MRFLSLAVLAAAAMGCETSAAQGGKLVTLEDSVSYILGFKNGENLKRQSVPVNAEVMLSALRDGLAGAQSRMPDSVMQSVMMTFQSRMIMQQRQKDSLSGAENRRQGEKFLAENQSKEGVKVTASGLQYKVLTAGTGPRPQKTSVVTVHYRGTLLDGKEFDSSIGREPVSFSLTQVIPGWVEGIQLMNVGSKYQFWIPSHIGYGPQGSPPDIPPDAVLVFEVELLGMK
ncbi:MAG: FKBP-type peptidyl-prolyl cis-trans isomerase [Gemmatimonadota bacterium]|nr:FKBP-type peptidyl-prolyl cis-trans isomerase [Gemmatimonadota bacterium]MDH4348476.1 FKBP-type peptidyl-prolyl cis-trans isomerase [Gemmatimonadota bacterium]MDH5283281.1 FKBP-type peptidyl-prolyl cis-trans isomerase [Gemmatimonadota bacterium]